MSRLRGEAAAAVQNRDAAAFERLFRTDSAGPHYARQYFDELFAGPVAGLSVTVVDRQALRFLVLRGESTGGSLCSSWTIQYLDGRSVLTTVPPLSDPCATSVSEQNPPFATVDVHGVAA
ncbi:hypothetical protein [Streptomyces hygroscopicus]|uniref:hypothetical protein n=1 Tax=Streptomyces sp. KHY 26 TaxID=3097359 RepID=UPI0025539FE3|nr:hypothetical protein [Streptomyces hygroscopicus]